MSFLYEYEEEKRPGENDTAEMTVSIGQYSVMFTCYESHDSANVVMPIEEARKLGSLLQNFGKDAK